MRADTKFQVVQYAVTGLASANHTLRIQATGQHNSTASSSWVGVDAFEWLSRDGGAGVPDFSIAITPTAATVVQGSNSLVQRLNTSPTRGNIDRGGGNA